MGLSHPNEERWQHLALLSPSRLAPRESSIARLGKQTSVVGLDQPESQGGDTILDKRILEGKEMPKSIAISSNPISFLKGSILS